MPAPITVVNTITEVRSAVAAARQAGLSVGLVPTMGALHAGHASLLKAARAECDRVVVSIFVNPTQFGPGEDFQRYPRPLEEDLQLCTEIGVDTAFVPEVEELYRPGAQTIVEVSGLQDVYEGKIRPGHFRGVCTVVLKLLNIVTPDRAYFGQKDAQQLRIIQQMTRDLDLNVNIRVGSTVREPDGLALSSRNRYLSPVERAVAPGLFRALADVQGRYREGERQTAALLAELRSGLLSISDARIDYAEIVDAESFTTPDHLERPGLALAAITLGTTRLIDNVTLP